MKNKILILAFISIATFLISCKTTENYKEIRYANLQLDTLSRSDYKIVGNCTAEATISKKGGKLESKYASKYQQGSFDNFISVAANPTIVKTSKFFSFLLAKKSMLVTDPGRDFVMYALFEKYPDIDYFMGVTINRITATTGKSSTEQLKVKAIGVKLIVDDL